MGVEIFKKDVLFFQRIATGSGLYHGDLDGEWGPLSQGAFDALGKIYLATKATYGGFDPRTEGNIATLLPQAQRAARLFLTAAKSFPLQIQILSGTRTYAEQNALYAKRPIVTRASGGHSNHNFGIAFDVGIFNGKTYYTGATRVQEKAYEDLRKHTKRFGPALDWGGDWKSIVDKPHYELHTGKTVNECRGLLEAGKPYV